MSSYAIDLLNAGYTKYSAPKSPVQDREVEAPAMQPSLCFPAFLGYQVNTVRRSYQRCFHVLLVAPFLVKLGVIISVPTAWFLTFILLRIFVIAANEPFETLLVALSSKCIP